VTFQSNEIQIAFADPTPAPATPTPRMEPTPEPSFVAVTMPPSHDPNIGAIPRTIQSVLTPILIACGLLLVGSSSLLIVATKRRMGQRKASEAAYDHLERSRHRDYVTPAVTEEKPRDRMSGKGGHIDERIAQDDGKESSPMDRSRAEVPLDDVELPHLKYVRDAYVRNKEAMQKQRYHGMPSDIYDDNLYEMEDVYPGKRQMMDEGAYDDPHGDGYEDLDGDDGFMPDDRVISPYDDTEPEPSQSDSAPKEPENHHTAVGTERTKRRARERGAQG